MPRSELLHQTSSPSFDPTQGASQIGARVISGDIPSTSGRVSILAMVMIFPDETFANGHYATFVKMLGDVGADGLIRQPIEGISGDRFGNMGERIGLVRDIATLWVSSYAGAGEERGAIFVRNHGQMFQMLVADPYVGSGDARAVYLLERAAERIAARERDLTLPPEADTMSHLPILTDVFGLLEHARVDFNRYWAQT